MAAFTDNQAKFLLGILPETGATFIQQDAAHILGVFPGLAEVAFMVMQGKRFMTDIGSGVYRMFVREFTT